jgi:uridine kinase
MERTRLLEDLADLILDIERSHPVRVGINGIDASGKTFFTKELKSVLEKRNKKVILASIDRFHNPRHIRYQRGRNSPEGYYLDSFNHDALIRTLLDPLGPKGDLEYQNIIFDYLNNKEIKSEKKLTTENSILLMEGIFLFRPELISYWDFKIFLDVDFEVTQRRVTERTKDKIYLGDSQNILEKYRQRYIPGQKLYFAEVDPCSIADVVIDNNDFNSPELAIFRKFKDEVGL